MNVKTIHLSDGTSYAARLVVRRDWIANTPACRNWRLSWENPGTSCYVNAESDVTGDPFFRTMRAAVAYGIRRYGITAVRVAW